MKVLAIDYGTRRIGMAVGDDVLRIALPFGVVEADTRESAIERIVRLVEVENVSQIVIGLPLGLDGREGSNAQRVREFGKKLEIAGKQIEYVDERFTSCEADRMGGAATRDEKAAMLILESYFGGK